MNHARPIHIGPAMQVIHPDYGNMTADVARELQLLNQQEADRVYAEAQQRQEKIATVCGRESVQRKGFRHVAQIDETVFNYWEAREGKDFWKHELNYMLKRHPEMAIKAVNPNPVFGYVGAPKTSVKGKRGRWAL